MPRPRKEDAPPSAPAPEQPTKRTAPVNPMSILNGENPPPPEWNIGDAVRYTVDTLHVGNDTHGPLLGTVTGVGEIDPDHPDKGKAVDVEWGDGTKTRGDAKHWDPDVDRPYAIHLKRQE